MSKEIMKNKLKKRLENGEKTVGAWMTIPHTDISEALSTLPFDWFVFDQEHSTLDDQLSQQLMQGMRGTDVTPLVRVAWNDMVLIKKALDTGAYGVIIPWVNSKEDAVNAVRACKYPPEGVRGCGPRRTTLLDPEYLETVNDELLIIVQIETREAINNVEEILAVDGIDGFFLGPVDLSTSLGHMGDVQHPEVQHAIEEVFNTGTEMNAISGIWKGAGMTIKERIEEGWQMVSLGMDIEFLMKGSRDVLSYGE
ncbi:MAG: aldolase/citrate lyase family protein [Euryarchaeota archaeon]|nr:aldolase/citrate lyase family protein [Euryarchaeota archaeon]